MKRSHIVRIVALFLTVVGCWMWLRSFRFDIHWGGEWPQEGFRASATATEAILPANGRKASASDRARAAERAGWKAYYYAQLRAAERLGEVRIDSRTHLSDLLLQDQELLTTYRGTLQAAAEVESERRTRDLGDAVEAQVTVALPSNQIRSLRSVLLRAISSGRVTFERRPQTPFIRAAFEREANDRPGLVRAPKTQKTPAIETPPAPPAPKEARVSERPRPQAVSYTGALIRTQGDLSLLAAAPILFDASGTEIGSSFDLPADRIASGFPIARPDEAAAIARWVGDRAREFSASLSGGDLFLEESLEPEEVAKLREWLQVGRVVLVAG